jgi:hypothetical protein
MSLNQKPNECPDCGPSRRKFLKTAAGGIAAVSAASLLRGIPAFADDAPKAAASETLVAQLYKSLTEEQKKEVCFAFDHPLRTKVDNNWHIVKKTIADFYTKDQQALIRDIFNGLHSEEYAKIVMGQVEHDNVDDGGFGGCAVALFGEPGAEGKKFEFVFTGRHVTRRCDGNSVDGAAFGGPIFYGHASKSFNEKPDHAANVYWYQGLRANEVFKALDGKQREKSLRTDPRKEEGEKTVQLSGKKELHGVPMADLSKDQKELVRKVMLDVLAPFRKVDAEEALKLVEANGGFEQLSMAFYKNMDIGNDGVWDVWQIEGPSMLWYFRGAPHVHTWVNIRQG